MLIVACVLICVAAVPLTGGDLSRLTALRWRRWWLVLLALAVQLVVLELSGLSEPLAAGAHVASYGLAFLFVWSNRGTHGLGLLALGAGANGLTILLNAGTLPSSEAARRLAGLDEVRGFTNSGVVADPVLAFLGDNYAVPAWVPLANVFSIGDVLIVLGAAWVVLSVTRPPRAPGRAGPQHARRPADGARWARRSPSSLVTRLGTMTTEVLSARTPARR